MDIRQTLNILSEARPRRSGASAVARPRDKKAAPPTNWEPILNQTIEASKRIGQAFHISYRPDWSKAVHEAVRAKMAHHRTEHAKEQAEIEADGGQTRPFDENPLELILDTAQAYIGPRLRGDAAHIKEQIKEYQTRKFHERNPDDPESFYTNHMDYIEDSDFLRCCEAQQSLEYGLASFNVKTVKDYTDLCHRTDSVAMTVEHNQQDEELVLYSEDDLAVFFPLMIYLIRAQLKYQKV